MSVYLTNFLIYGIELSDEEYDSLDEDIKESLRRNSYRPQKGGIVLLKDSDGRFTYLGINIAHSKDEFIGGFDLFGIEIKTNPEYKKTLKKQILDLGLEYRKDFKFFLVSFYH